MSTSTTAFIGKAEKGPLDRAVMVTSFIEFQATYGGFLDDSYLAHSALKYFDNGGKRLYVLRVARDAGTAEVVIGDRKGAPAKTLTVTATSAGKWGNDLEVVVANGTLDPGDEFKLSIRKAGSVVEVFDNLSIVPTATNFVANVVNARSRHVKVKADTANESTLAGTSTSGASPATSLPAGKRKLVVDIDGDGPQTLTLADPVTTGAEIATAISNAVHALPRQRASTKAEAFSGFTCAFSGGAYVLSSGATGKQSSVKVSSDASAADAASFLKLGTANGGAETTGAAVLRPATGTFLLGDGVVGGATLAVTLGNDGLTPQDGDFLGALSMLDPVQDVNILAIPGIGSKAVVEAGTAYCQQRMDCFFVGDMLATVDTKEAAQSFTNSLTVKSSYGAVYFPWLTMVDPTGASADPIPIPPSGFVAGQYARTDARRGVWKAPAGTEANVVGAVGLTKQLTDTEQDVLNPFGVNALRFFPSSGIVIWGARTLATQSDPEYRYIPVRRLAIFLERSIYNGIQWAVFEPNDEELWSSLRLNINAFMMTQFRAGAFQGSTASQAFFVKCDRDTNPQDQVNAGVVTVLVGFAPLRPAEFVVLRISQKTDQTAA
ncbi:phage tail sheath subtilisin-like domain-containing protein [Myxococcus stipitatus]|uniref:phage tail sheath subtilisin-like domain-containing protein n=1 Tax=Myxococcus stipitatus TaxID=83455 RepID=UPI001F2CD8FE|nr:phage tail sheath subtilisin-like domain-containing protein [Myxococcus stipitatus]MCE9672848.1 phage tail sheath subtilisin-like domain-containing protein [Myxococcus stipitatus]